MARVLKKVQSFALALSILLCSLFSGTPTTPKGVQCPTAAVQTVSDIVNVKSKFGKLVEQTIQRKPREGESTFLQCRCAEKKAADTQQKAESTESSRFSFVAILTCPIHFDVPTFTIDDCPIANRSAHLIVSHPAEPSTPLPQVI